MTYHYIPEAQKQLVLGMSLRGMKEKHIMYTTEMGRMTNSRINTNWKNTHTVAVELVAVHTPLTIKERHAQATKRGCLYKYGRTRWILRMHLGFCI